MTWHAGFNDAPYPVARQPRPRAWIARLSFALTFCFLLYVFVGLNPLSSVTTLAERVSGNVGDRLMTLGMTAVALVVVLADREASKACLRGNVLVVMVTGFCLLSTVWSDYPDLTLRRALISAMLCVIAMATAVGLTSLRRLHTLLFVTLFGVILINLVSVALWPALAITDIGVAGIYSQKNVAGMVAMIALVVCVTWTAGSRAPLQWLAGLLATVVIAGFLAITSSKTSIVIAVVALAVGTTFWLAAALGPTFVLLLTAALLAGAAGFLVMLAANDFDLSSLVSLVLTDTTFTGRDELWSFAWRKASERPWLGHGYGAFWDVGEANDPLARLEPGTWLGDVPKGVINQAHNGYLELWLQIGLPATIVAVASVVAALAAATRLAVVSAPHTRTRATYGAIALVLLMYLMHNFTESTLFLRGNQFFLLVLMLMFVVSHARNRPAAP